MSEIEQALEVADRVMKVVVAKFPGCVGFVRRYETGGQQGYIEIMMKPENGNRSDEMTTAYADEFFLSMVNMEKEARQEKARRVLNDFKLLFGAK